MKEQQQDLSEVPTGADWGIEWIESPRTKEQIEAWEEIVTRCKKSPEYNPIALAKAIGIL